LIPSTYHFSVKDIGFKAGWVFYPTPYFRFTPIYSLKTSVMLGITAIIVIIGIISWCVHIDLRKNKARNKGGRSAM